MNSPGLFAPLLSQAILSLFLTQVRCSARETRVLPILNPHETFLRGEVV